MHCCFVNHGVQYSRENWWWQQCPVAEPHLDSRKLTLLYLVYNIGLPRLISIMTIWVYYKGCLRMVWSLRRTISVKTSVSLSCFYKRSKKKKKKKKTLSHWSLFSWSGACLFLLVLIPVGFYNFLFLVLCCLCMVIPLVRSLLWQWWVNWGY